MSYDPLTMDPFILAVRRGNYLRLERPVTIRHDTRAEGAGGKEVKFQLEMRPLDHTHTHGEMTRADQQAITAVLAKAGAEIVAILRQVPPPPS